MNAKTATLCGLLAIMLWGSLVGLIRSVTQHFGPLVGAACIYTLGSLLLLCFIGLPRLKNCSPGYLFGCGLLFVAYEICLTLSIGFAHHHRQAIEVSMLNYLWPCLTVLLAIVINRQHASLWIIPGSLLALFGVFRILSGEAFSLADLHDHVTDNPLSYGLALGGAMIWALYCNLTRRFARGQNGITLFFILTAASLWLISLYGEKTPLPAELTAYAELAAVAVAMAAGYALWNMGILHGNMTLLAIASYFTPVLSSAFAALWLQNALHWPFWQGVILVTVGSLLCWWSTRK